MTKILILLMNGRSKKFQIVLKFPFSFQLTLNQLNLSGKS